jgi:hypothetical protein
MTREEVEALREGDIVIWRDPDEDSCTKRMVIKTIITCNWDDNATIIEPDGGLTRVLFSELEDGKGTNV